MFWKVFKMAPLSVVVFPFLILLSWIVGTFGSWVISPLLASWSVITKNPTPKGFWAWFYTHDNTLDGGWDVGIDGYKNPLELSFFGLIWQRMCWICRNPGYGFNAFVFGFKGQDNVDTVFQSGIPYPPDKYWYVVKDQATGKLYFGYRGKKAWVGWNYLAYGGYHQLKTRPWSFGD